MKKIAFTAIACAAALSLSACGKSEDATEAAATDNVEMPAEELPAVDTSAAAAPVEAPAADATPLSAEDAARNAADSAAAAAADVKKAAADAAADAEEDVIPCAPTAPAGRGTDLENEGAADGISAPFPCLSGVSRCAP
jgi:hypothetical protein